MEPRLSDQGAKEFERFIELFKKRMAEVMDDALSNAYINLPDYIESDAWCNFRNTAMDVIRGYKTLSPYEARAIRDQIFADHRTEIIKEIDRDNVHRITQLEEQVRYLREARDMR